MTRSIVLMATSILAIAMLAQACATLANKTTAETRPERPDVLTDTGYPLSEGLKQYDVDRYELRHEILPKTKSIAGSSTIFFTAVEPMDVLELDFDGLFTIDGVTQGDASATFDKTPTKLFVTLPTPLAVGDTGTVTVAYHGKPMEAVRAPWDGGFVWSETPESKQPWIATAIQGEGCDVWWPCKDHPLGEPRDGADLIFTVPAGLTAVANGVLVETKQLDDGRTEFHWRTNYSTNIYGIALNVGPYVLIEDDYTSVNGETFPVKFWALQEREDKARKLFDTEFAQTIEFFERVLGPYPWPKEKLGVVETPHLGMEHQTVNAYGNEYRRGTHGYDWLFQHELAHEWFGNLMSSVDNSDLWLHEGTGAYMQPVYAQELLGDAVFHHARYQSYLGIYSCVAVSPRTPTTQEGIYSRDKGGPGGDIYSKGAAVLHSMRFLMGEDKFWNAIRRLLYDTIEPWSIKQPEPIFRTTDDFLAIASDEYGQPLDWFFETYIRNAEMPTLETTIEDGVLTLEWTTPTARDFPMPVPVRIDGKVRTIAMPGGKATVRVGDAKIVIDPDFSVVRRLSSMKTCEEREAEEAARRNRD